MTTAEARRPVVALAQHAGYACRSSGACCSSGWPIPVEDPVRAGLEWALADGSLELARSRSSGLTRRELLPRDASPPGAGAARLGYDAAGRCVFLETGAAADTLLEAVRATDLLLLHLADPQRLSAPGEQEAGRHPRLPSPC